jgi:hypothetical protein
MSTLDAVLTGDITVITRYWYEQLEANKGALGIRQVFDGDRILIQETPTVAVVAGQKSRELYGASMMSTVEMAVYFLVYHKRLQPSVLNEREVQELTQTIEDFIHSKVNAEGRVQVGLVTLVEPGYADRQGTTFRTTRMTWEARSRDLLPSTYN